MAASPEKSIFLDALEYEAPAEREAFLDRACGGDGDLRSSVKRLLAAHQRDDNPLDHPVALLPEDLQAQQDGNWFDGDTLDYRMGGGEALDTTIGAYRLREQIGEGGFGIVYVAEQQQPVKRRVALKILKPGMDTREVIARFEAERQALALMDHPNIARVFDGGATATGRPYFVMELVRGVPITQFCDEQKLDARERLELFVTVCRAVQHAHQKGVIHRDLKPSNILITLHDGEPVAKVIDFGVAKAIGPSMTDKTIYTRFTAMIGTPLYMSPEQAEMTSQDVDTRSDIYSLGVILYELLTGSTPFDGERLREAGLDEVRRIIREELPPLPSSRLSTLGPRLSTISATRRSDPGRLPALVRGDLDWIVMRAMDKDRNRRYDTANALAADITRYLRAEPVEARPPSRRYRLWKFAKRNKVALTTAGLVLAAMVLGTAVSVWQAVEATRERNDKEAALAQARAAEQEASEALAQLEQFNAKVIQANALLASGNANAQAQRWPAAEADFTDAVELTPNYYLSWQGRGSFYVELGLWQEAADDFRQALALGAEPTGSEWAGVPALFAMLGDQQQYQPLRSQLLAEALAGEHLPPGDLRACLLEPLERDAARKLAAAAQDYAERVDRPPRDPLGFGFGGPPRDGRGEGQPPPGGEGNGPRPQRGPREFGGPPPREPGDGPGGPRGPGGRGGRLSEPRGVLMYVAGWSWTRASYHRRAVGMLERAKRDPAWPARDIVDPVLAIALHHMGEDERAKETLEQAEESYDRWMEDMLSDPIGRMPIPWFDWVEFLAMRREATELIEGRSPADDPRLEQLSARAHTAVAGDFDEGA